MKAIITHRGILGRLMNLATGSAHGPGASVSEVPDPSIAADQILVRVKAVTLNPTDFKHIDALAPPRSIAGCDYAGEVVQVGPAVTSSWRPGDRVAGCVHGGLFPDRGSFAELLKVDADLAWRIPDAMSDTDAASYGVSGVTGMLALNVRHGLPWPSANPEHVDEHVLVYAGGTTVGLFSIQIAKAAGYKVVTTASPRSRELAERYGADAVFDYSSPTVADDILARFPHISKAVDCFSEGKSADICARVVRPSSGKVFGVLPGKHEYVMMYTLFGHDFQILPPIGPHYPASPTDRAALVKFYAMLPSITSVVRPPPVAVTEGGFNAILAGLDKLRHKQASGGKLGIIM